MKKVLIEAGQVLDHEVAKKVMGWKEIKMSRGSIAWQTNDTGGWMPKDAFRPSSNMTDAWVVVQKIGDRLDTIHQTDRVPKWWEVVLFHDVDGREQMVKGEGPTAALAICAAALEMSRQ